MEHARRPRLSARDGAHLIRLCIFYPDALIQCPHVLHTLPELEAPDRLRLVDVTAKVAVGVELSTRLRTRYLALANIFHAGASGARGFMRLFGHGKPIIGRYVRVETESDSESGCCAIDPHAVASGENGPQGVASAGNSKAALLRDPRANDEGVLGQQLRLREAMLALVFLLGATCWERPAEASLLVFLVVVVLHP